MAAGTHRLAVVMFTDLVGYTARSQHNEPEALRLLEEHRKLLRPKFEEHRGREVKTIGDAFLVEFDSALNATGCAIAIQRALYERNLHETQDSIDVRIGIHLGEVAADGGDINGDAVNVASRIYPLADPGGICLSEPVFAQVRGKLDLSVEKLPPTALKNVTYPVEVFRVLLPWSERGLSAVLPWTDRESEMETVQRSLATSLHGEGGILMLVGEVGIGKTRLADEAFERGRKSGFRVLRGRCAPGDLAIPYAPWIEAFRQFVHEAPPPVLYRTLGPHSREVARLVPEVVEKVGQLPTTLAMDADQARLQFLDGIGQFVDRLTAEGPLVVFLDDLHWADPASTLLLRHLLPRLRKRPVLVLGAYRKTEEEGNRSLREALGELRRDHLLTTVSLGRLSADQVGQLIAEMFHTGEVSREFRELVHARTGGNPLLIEEVLRALVKDRVIYWSGTAWERRPVDQIEIPEGVKEIISQRLSRFDEKGIDLLRLASVIGYEFDFDLLQKISGEEEATLLDLIEGLLRGRLIQEVAGPHGRSTYVFADHPTRDVLYDEVSLVRKRRLHLKIGQALERLGDKAIQGRAAELAHHYLQGNDVAKAREFSIRAAQQASSVFAHSESYRNYRTALELIEEEGDEVAKADVLSRLGPEALALGRRAEALGYLLQADELFEKQHRSKERADVLAPAATVAREDLGDAPKAVALARKAVEVLETFPEGPELANACVSLGVVLLTTGELEEGREQMERAATIARRLNLVDVLATSLQFLGHSLPWNRKAEGLAETEEAVRIAEEGGAVRTATKLVNHAFILASTKGDYPAALRVADRGLNEAERRGQLQYFGFAHATKATILVHMGRWTEARKEAEAALSPGEAHGGLAAAIALANLAIIEAGSGELGRMRELADQVRKIVDGLHEVFPSALMETRLVDRALDDGGSDPVAEGRLETMLATARANETSTISRARFYAIVVTTVAELRLRQDRADEVAPLAEELVRLARELDEPWCAAYRDKVLGELAFEGKRFSEAVPLLSRSAENFEMSALPYEEARSRALLGTALASSGDADAARGAYDSALGLFEKIGARAPLDRIHQLREGRGVAHP